MIRTIVLSVLFCGALNLPCRGAIIFSESFGDPGSSPTPISSYSGYTNGVGLTFSGTGDVRNTSPSNYSGASAGGNVFLTNNGTSTLQISGINTLGYASSSFGLSFGAFKSAIASNLTELVIAYSTDNTTFFNLSPSIPAQPTGSGTAIWRLLSGMIGLRSRRRHSRGSLARRCFWSGRRWEWRRGSWGTSPGFGSLTYIHSSC